MPHYRVHILDSFGKVIGAGQFDCVNRERKRASNSWRATLIPSFGSSSRRSGQALNPAWSPVRPSRELGGP
jgi:hypothetical protein